MPLRGIIPPMITPLVDRDTLDAAGLERLVEHLIDGGVHGIFILGTTGEAPSLSYRAATGTDRSRLPACCRCECRCWWA